MQKITLDVEDLARIKIVDTFGRYTESIFAVDALRHSRMEAFQPWRRRIIAKISRAGGELDGVRQLTRVPGGSREILAAWPVGAGPAKTARPGIPVLHQPRLLAAVDAMYQVAVKPHWSHVRDHLTSALEARRDIMCSDGIEALLNSLGPGIRWKAPVLEIESDITGHVEPNGRGLLLSPSLFVQGAGAVVPSLPGAEGSGPVLVYPDHPGDHCGSPLNEGLPAAPAASCRPRESLAALVGRTRAAILHALRDGYGNGELAESLGISPTAVSQHTSTLRNAGLISTRRRGGQVVHTVTALGRHLLRDGSDSSERCGGAWHAARRPVLT
ncbi:ArsR/SmtB family transcription factor [Streptomyces chrestomyceticus]|uniref:ArsR/SmtB family transcription factor n=1 Tax=Streptomyces chrestomyceticus TaxID=68185 RepID=UPI003691D1DB